MERAELLEKFGSALTGKESLITLGESPFRPIPNATGF